MDQTPWKAGLEDVIAARSAVCAIDGAAGRLFYRGYEIAELAGAVPFEEVAALLWRGERPDAAQAADFRTRLEAARGLPGPIEALLRALPRDCHPLDGPATIQCRHGRISRTRHTSSICSRDAPRRPTWPRC